MLTETEFDNFLTQLALDLDSEAVVTYQDLIEDETKAIALLLKRGQL